MLSYALMFFLTICLANRFELFESVLNIYVVLNVVYVCRKYYLRLSYILFMSVLSIVYVCRTHCLCLSDV